MKSCGLKINSDVKEILKELTTITGKSEDQIIREALTKLREEELRRLMIEAAKQIMEKEDALRDIEELESTVGDGL